MPSDRLLRILSRLARVDAGGGASPLCAVSAEVTAMSGASIMLLSGDVPRGSVCTTNDVSLLLEELQFTLGEGPCIDAHRLGRPVVEVDLADPATSRWTEFSRSAVAAGARAVFGFPLAVAGLDIGALNLYRDRPGPLTADQHADAIVLAGVAARSILSMQADAAPDVLAPGLEVSGNFRFSVHQAAGMISEQLDVHVDEALVRLRARAFSTGRPVSDVADDVISRRVRFTRGEEG